MHSIIFQWPGYESVDFVRTIETRGITFSKLAGRVALYYEEFFEVGPRLYSPVCLSLNIPSFLLARQKTRMRRAWLGHHSPAAQDSAHSGPSERIPKRISSRSCRLIRPLGALAPVDPRMGGRGGSQEPGSASANRPTSGSTIRVGTIC